MGIIVNDCRQCSAQQIAMTLHGAFVPQSEAHHKGSPRGYIIASCSRCEEPNIFLVDYNGTATWAGVASSLDSYVKGNSTQNISARDYRVIPFEPTGRDTSLPEHLPSDVEKALSQAETNFRAPDHEEAAATMYRRALERAVKFKYPNLDGALAKKISTLVAEGLLPNALGEWATEIRLVGNDGAHDSSVDRSDLKAARDFCDAFLRYLITLPAEIELRRGATK